MQTFTLTVHISYKASFTENKFVSVLLYIFYIGLNPYRTNVENRVSS